MFFSLVICLLASQLVFLKLIGSVELGRASKTLKLSKVEVSPLVISLVTLRDESLITESAFQRSVSYVRPSMHDQQAFVLETLGAVLLGALNGFKAS